MKSAGETPSPPPPTPPPPEPKTPEERIRANIEETLAIRPEDIKGISVQEGGGCRQVGVDYATSSPTSVETQMRQVYEAIYADAELGETVCGVTLNAYGKLTDQYGQRSEEMFYSTTIDRATADRINWEESYGVRFPDVWTLNYIHPVVEAEIAQEEASAALDCAMDEGLFDVDMFCP